MECVNKFSFFSSFYEAAQDLTDEQRLSLYDAMCAYAFEGFEPSFSGVMSTIWKLIKPNLDSSIKGQKTGATGGRPKAKTGGFNPPLKGNKTHQKTDMDMNMDKEREKEKEVEGFSLGKKNPSTLASVGAGAAKPAPPAAIPHCPLCDVKTWKNTQTGRYQCPNCEGTFTSGDVVWR